MKLSDWAASQGISYYTAWRWFKTGQLPVKAIKTPSGSILIEPDSLEETSHSVCIYARVSSHEKKDDLERQAQRCIEFARARGWEVELAVKEIASGMNDSRPKLEKLLKSRPTRILVEHKDRLTRFGFTYFETLLPMIGCELVVMDRDAEETADLMKDLISIITSFACRMYGLRRGRSKAAKIKRVLCEERAR